MRLVFFGTPSIAVPTLQSLVRAGHDVRLVITGVDKRRGRGSATSPSPVKEAATELGIPVAHKAADAIDADAELGVVVAYGRLIKPDVLHALPCINLHFSDLPRWRGAAPVERAILAGDTHTAVCVMDIEETLDTGGIYARERVELPATKSLAEIQSELADLGAELLVRTLGQPLGAPTPQVGEPVYADKLSGHDRRVAWNGSAEQAFRVVRLGDAHTAWRGERLKVRGASGVVALVAPADPGTPEVDGVVCGDANMLGVTEVQPAGKARMSYDAWRNGAYVQPHERLGAE